MGHNAKLDLRWWDGQQRGVTMLTMKIKYSEKFEALFETAFGTNQGNQVNLVLEKKTDEKSRAAVSLTDCNLLS